MSLHKYTEISKTDLISRQSSKFHTVVENFTKK